MITTQVATNHDWWHAQHVHHNLVCLKCGLGWHDIKDIGAIAHSCGNELTGGYGTDHTEHYDKCCEIDNRCKDER